MRINIKRKNKNIILKTADGKVRYGKAARKFIDDDGRVSMLIHLDEMDFAFNPSSVCNLVVIPYRDIRWEKYI